MRVAVAVALLLASVQTGYADYFAEVDDAGIVLRVIVADQAFIDSGRVGDPSRWVRAAVDGSVRKNYPGIGYVYNRQRDAFTPPKPHPSWTLDQRDRWVPPRQKPASGGPFVWDEQARDWVPMRRPER